SSLMPRPRRPSKSAGIMTTRGTIQSQRKNSARRRPAAASTRPRRVAPIAGMPVAQMPVAGISPERAPIARVSIARMSCGLLSSGLLALAALLGPAGWPMAPQPAAAQLLDLEPDANQAGEDQYAVAAAHYAARRWDLAAVEFETFLKDHPQ